MACYLLDLAESGHSFGQSNSLYLQQQIQNSMSRTMRGSYESFRRKTSLNSSQLQQRNDSPEQAQARERSKDRFEEVENLSLQLNSLRQRSQTSRSYSELKDIPPPHINMAKPCEMQSQKKSINFHPNLQLLPSVRFLNEKVSFDSQTPKQNREKLSNLSFFNQFHTIQEKHFSDQQEALETEQPAMYKLHSQPTPKTSEKKPLLVRHVDAKNVNALRKPVVIGRGEFVQSKKEKIKQDLQDLDKMQRELEGRRGTREPTFNKPTLNSNLQRRVREPAAKQLNNKQPFLKQPVKPLRPIHHFPLSKPALQLRSNRNNIKSATNLMMGVKMGEKLELLHSKEEKEGAHKGEKKEQMVATRMITEKQKQGLIHQLLILKDIIDKNEICANNLQEVTSKLHAIQELLTR